MPILQKPIVLILFDIESGFSLDRGHLARIVLDVTKKTFVGGGMHIVVLGMELEILPN